MHLYPIDPFELNALGAVLVYDDIAADARNVAGPALFDPDGPASAIAAAYLAENFYGIHRWEQLDPTSLAHFWAVLESIEPRTHADAWHDYRVQRRRRGSEVAGEMVSNAADAIALGADPLLVLRQLCACAGEVAV